MADKTEEEIAAEQVAAEQSKKDEIAKILEELKQDDPKPAAASSQPVVSNDRRKDFMEKNKVSEAQMQALENGNLTDQRLAIMELKAKHKDFDLLEKAFHEEVKKYNREYFRVVDASVADDLFMAVKGREVTNGRYKMVPNSQPQNTSSKKSDSSVVSSRLATFNSGDAGLEKEESRQGENELTDREKAYAAIVDVDPADYAKEKAKKVAGIREIADRAYIRPERVTSGNSADYALNEMQRKHGVRV